MTRVFEEKPLASPGPANENASKILQEHKIIGNLFVEVKYIIKYNAVSRTAPATPVLLITYTAVCRTALATPVLFIIRLLGYIVCSPDKSFGEGV